MSQNVAQLLSDPERNWRGNPGARDSDLSRLLARCSWPLPHSLVELLRFSNGGEGDLALDPLIFVLDDVEQIIESFEDPFLTGAFPGFLFVGGNGGLESVALDCRAGTPPFPVVMIDRIAGPESAVEIATDMSEFVLAIGLALPDQDE